MMTKRKRKASITAYILVVCMLVGMFPSTAFAEQEEVFACGQELHTHSESCYEGEDEQKTLICEEQEHTHTEDCLPESAKAPQDGEDDTNAGENDTNNLNDSNDDSKDDNLDETKKDDAQQITDNDDENADEDPDAAKDPDATEEKDENTDDTEDKSDEQQTEQDSNEEEQQSEVPKKARTARVAAQADGDHTDPNDHADYASGWLILTNGTTGITTSGNYYLDANVTLDDTITITGDVNVTLCLNGHELAGSGNGAVIRLEDGAKLTLCDCQGSSSNGKITGGNFEDGNGVVVFDNSELIMNSGKISKNGVNAADGKGGGVYIQGVNAKFTMNGGEISENVAAGSAGGGGVFVHEGATFKMSGGKISGNTATNGAGVYITNGCTFEMSGGEISGNTGGGVYVNGGTFKLSGDGTISGNTANNGGGVYIDGSNVAATFEMSGGTIGGATESDGNTVGFYGGGVYVEGEQATFKMTAGTISKNKSVSASGGGVHVNNGGEFTMTSGEISGNEADNGGGVSVCIYNTGNQDITTTFTMSGGEISGNTASDGGGGVFVERNNASKSASFTMSGGEITNNTANCSSGGGGGGVCVKDGTFTMNNMNGTSTISGNTARGDSGGGVYVTDGTFIMNDGTISGNTAALGGGGVFVQSNSVISSFTMSGNNSTISNNEAVMGGGVLINLANFTMTDGTISGNTANFIDGEAATGVGGGVCVFGQAVDTEILGMFQMSGGTISGNTANYDTNNLGTAGFGGGVYVSGGAFAMSEDSKVKENKAFGGGGVSLFEQATFTMRDNSDISGNKVHADGGGGGVYLYDGTFALLSGSVIGNILENTEQTDNNVFLPSSTEDPNQTAYRTVIISNELAKVDEGKVGITVEAPPTEQTPTIPVAIGIGSIIQGGIYVAKEADATYFVSDDPAYKVDFDTTNNTVILRMKQEFTVTFDLDGGITTAPTTQTVLEDGYAEALDPQPSKDGFFFGGWYKKDAAGELETEAFDFENTAITEAITLVAQWTDKPVVTFDLNYDGASTLTPQAVDPNTAVDEPDPAPTRDGYNFAGWYVDAACTNAYDFETQVTASITLYAKWTEKAATVTVTFDVDGGSTIDPATVEEGGVVTKPADPTKDGFQFGGWYTDAACTTEYNFDDPVTANLTLYAKWDAVEMVTVTFNSKGGSAIDPIEVEKGSKLDSLPTLTMPPFTFGGWCTDNACKNPFDINTPIDADITLYAKWNSGSISNPLKASASGKVVYLDGSPVKGATVTVSNLMTGAVEATTTTDSDGKYSFANLVAIPYRIAATITINGEEKTTGFQRISLKSGENSLADLRFLVNTAVVKVEVETGGSGSSSDAIVDPNGTTVDGLDKVLEQETQETEPDTATQITLKVEDPSESEPETTKKLKEAATVAIGVKAPKSAKKSTVVNVKTQAGQVLKFSGNKIVAPRAEISQVISEKMNKVNPPVVTTLPFPDGDKGLEMQKELLEQRASLNILKTKADEMLNLSIKVPTEILNMIENPNSAKPKTLAAYDAAVAAEYDETLRPDTFWIDDDGIHICMQDMGYYTIVYTEYELVETSNSTRTGRTGTWVKEDDKTEPKEPDVTQNTQDVPQNNQNTQQNAPITYANCPKDSRCPLYQFADVKVNEWYHDGVHYCIENGLMAGTGTTSFEPNAKATRAMVVAILWRLENSPVVDSTTNFNDVAEGAYYKDAVCWAVSKGIVSGYDEKTFAPNESITREQMASILYRYAQYKGLDVSVAGNLEFDDVNELSDYAVQAMKWACGMGIINGTSTTTLSPKGNATRAQIAQMLKVYIN